jgi:hypothetical protein
MMAGPVSGQLILVRHAMPAIDRGLRRRSLHAYLIDALRAHARGDPAPLLA